MLRDYKALNDRDIFSGRQPPKRLRMLILGLLLLTATAIYASLRMFGGTDAANEPSSPDQPLIKASLDNTPAREMRTVPLQLPGQTNPPPAEDQYGTPQPPAAPTTQKATLPAEEADEADEETAVVSPEPDGESETETAGTPDEEVEQATTQTSQTEEEIEADTGDTTDPEGRWVEETVRSGDSLAKIFARMGLTANLLHRITHSSPEAKALAKIRPGQKLRVHLDDSSELLELVLQRTPVESLCITAEDGGFAARVEVKELEVRTTQSSGIITNSLYESALEAGLPDALIMDLANIFGWDIDFALEIRKGDSFSLVYEESYLEGEKYGNGAILAAEFVNRGKTFRAVRYEDDEGHVDYFSPDGKSMRKSFLRAPVDFRRISSRFTRERFHPVLGKKRPHRGVDYAAATGTPIKASGDGKVVFRGRKGGYGRTVIIQHANQYTTLYAHLSKYRSSVKDGSRVKQGQVIGYVGKSGLATGPHLHYEFRVNGVHRNPLTVKLPAASPIAAKYRTDFEKKSAVLLARLDLISRTLLADAR